MYLEVITLKNQYKHGSHCFDDKLGLNDWNRKYHRVVGCCIEYVLRVVDLSSYVAKCEHFMRHS